MKIAILGTGIMGAGVAKSLLREQFDVTVWNRDSGKSEPLAAEGARVADSPADAVRGADAVLTILFDADAVIEVMTSAVDTVESHAVWLQCSTIGLDGTTRAAELAAAHGIRLIDGPMLGTKTPAEQGSLVMLVSGDSETIELARPVLDAMGSKTVVAGQKVGQATALKLAANAWVQTLTAAVAQSLAIADGLGIDPNLFLEAIKGGATDTPYAHVKGAAMLAGEYPASFAIDGVIKDLGLIEAGAMQAGVDEALLTKVRESYERASDAGHGDDDMAAVYTAFRGDRP